MRQRQDGRGATVSWFLCSGTVATRQRPDDPRLDPGGVGAGQENTNDEEIFRSGACKHKAGSLSINRMALDTGRLCCVFDSGTASDGTLNMRLYCSDPDEKQSSMCVAQFKLRPDKKIELIVEPMDQQ